MKRTVRIALKPTPQQAQTLRETLRQSTECFNAVCQYGWDNNEKNSADLVYSKGKWHLHVVLTFPTPKFVDNGQAIGVDLGLNRPAVTSHRHFLGKRRWREVSHRYFRHCRTLASKGTKSAKRRLRALSGKTAQFRRDCDHVLSKQIVHSALPGTTIIVENLLDIRTSAKQRGVQSRRRLHSWSFAQFRSFLTYKAGAMGCQVAAIDPRHTSQRCSLCGFIHRGNRASQSVFRCKACRYELNADLNASINIAAKYLARDGTSVSGGPL